MLYVWETILKNLGTIIPAIISCGAVVIGFSARHRQQRHEQRVQVAMDHNPILREAEERVRAEVERARKELEDTMRRHVRALEEHTDALDKRLEDCEKARADLERRISAIDADNHMCEQHRMALDHRVGVLEIPPVRRDTGRKGQTH